MDNTGDSVVQSMAAQTDCGQEVNHGFVTIRSGACTLRVRSDLQEAEFLKLLPGGEAELGKRYALERIESAPTSRVFRFSISFGGADRVAYYKEYVSRSMWDAVKHVVRASRARRAFRASIMLAEHGIRAPEILVLGEVRRALMPQRCFLVTVAVLASEPVYILMGGNSSDLDLAELRRKRDLIRTLGRTIGQMHRRGIVHGDLRPGNILARYKEGQWQFYFLDNERTWRLPWLPARLRRKNLVQVGMVPGGVSRTDRFRFWRAYLAECPRLQQRHKRWARQIYARTIIRLAKCKRRDAEEAARRSGQASSSS
ncbi:MAG: hypothetical protein JSW27_18065 [Phycisphaerales bacterium]|nr:MAG: hypothetical protein JSW27_18065 [Phycisphaerales bacterium]